MRLAALTLLFLLPLPLFAACTEAGVTVVYVNGIFTTEKQAKQDLENIKFEFLNRIGDTSVIFKNGYNPSHLAGLGDLVQSTAQITGLPVSTYDRDTILLDIHPQVQTRRLLLVGHSQGTLYTNEMYEYLLANGEPREAVGVYNIASPTYYVAGGGTHLNSTSDSLLNMVEDTSGIPLLPRNVSIALDDADGASRWPGHGISRAYLWGAAERVVGDMEAIVAVLEPVDALEDGECFAPPAAGLGYKAAQIFFAVADPVANGAKTAAVAGYNGAVAALGAVFKAGAQLTDQLAASTASQEGGRGYETALVAAALMSQTEKSDFSVLDPEPNEPAVPEQQIDDTESQTFSTGPDSVSESIAPEEPIVPINPEPGYSPGGGLAYAPQVQEQEEAEVETPPEESEPEPEPIVELEPEPETPPESDLAIDDTYVAAHWPITGFYCDGDTTVLIPSEISMLYHPTSSDCNYLGGFSELFRIFRVYVIKGVVGNSTVVAIAGSNNSATKIYTNDDYDFATAVAGDAYAVVLTEYSTNIGSSYNAHLLPDMHSYLTTGVQTNGIEGPPDLPLHTIPFTYAP